MYRLVFFFYTRYSTTGHAGLGLACLGFACLQFACSKPAHVPKTTKLSCVFCVHQVRAAVACLGMQRFEQAAHFCRRAEALVRTSNCSRGLLPGVSEARVRTLLEQAEAGMARRKEADVLARARSKAAAWRSLGVQDALLQRRVLLGLSLSLSRAWCPSGTEVSLTLTRRALYDRSDRGVCHTMLAGHALYDIPAAHQGEITLEAEEEEEETEKEARPLDAAKVIWPMLFIYQEHQDSDYLRQVASYPACLATLADQ